MKRKKSVFFCLFFAAALLLTACSSSGGKESSAPIRIVGLKGPTSMGMVKLMADANENPQALPLSFELVNSPDQAVPMIMKGEADVAALPANLGAVIRTAEALGLSALLLSSSSSSSSCSRCCFS